MTRGRPVTDDDLTPGPEAEHATVQPGESFQQFAERVGVDAQRLRQLNETLLEQEARARGFAHTFIREVPGEDGDIRRRPDCHVFPGMVLRLRPEEKEE